MSFIQSLPATAQVPRESSRRWSLIAATAIALVAFGLTVYRAHHMPLTHDEALTYNKFLSSPFPGLFNYEANEHVLYTLISYAFVKVLGTSELAIRLPAVLAAVVYLGYAVLLSRRLFSPVWMVVSVALLAFNPIALDYLAAARGYGPALALYMVALYSALGWLEGLINPYVSATRQQNQLVAVSLALGLAVCAILTFAVPCAALAFVMVAVQFAVQRDWVGLRRTLGQLVWPGALVLFAVLWPFIPQIRRSMFYVGEKTFWNSIVQMTTASLLYKQSARSGMFEPGLSSSMLHAQFLASGLVLCLVVAVSVGVGFAIFRLLDRRMMNQSQAQFTLVAGTLCCCVAANISMNIVGKIKYPMDRTGIHFLPLLTLSVLLLCAQLPRGMARTVGTVVTGLISGAVLIVYALQMQVGFLYYARYDSGESETMNVILRDHAASTAGAADRPFTVGGSWLHEPSLNYYRQRLHVSSMIPFQRDTVSRPQDYDYFVFTPNDGDHFDVGMMKFLWTDPTSGTIVARVLHPATRPATSP